jgi:hypothetical protein
MRFTYKPNTLRPSKYGEFLMPITHLQRFVNPNVPVMLKINLDKINSFFTL